MGEVGGKGKRIVSFVKSKKRAAGMVIFTTPTALFIDWVMKLRFLPAQKNWAAYCSDGSNSRNYVIYSLI